MDKIFEVTITPLDTVFFRDAKPFTMGDDSWGDGLFPPAPSVLYGAIRSAYLYQHPHILEEGLVDTDQDPSKSIEVIGVNLNYKNSDLFPLPLDLVQDKNRIEVVRSNEVDRKREKKTYLNAKLLDRGSSEENFRGLRVGNILTGGVDKDVERIANGLIDLESLEDYYCYGASEMKEGIDVYTLDQFLFEEPKIGNQSARTLEREEDRALYRVGFKRMHKKLSFKLQVKAKEDFLLLDKSFVRLGGEGKLAKIKVEKPKEEEALDLDKAEFKILLTSPAFFDKGWFSQELADAGFELITAAVGNPVAIGGFDLAKKCPKPLRKAVPAGSVYYYRGNSVAAIKKFFNGRKSLCTAKSDQKQGYGLFKLAKI